MPGTRRIAHTLALSALLALLVPVPATAAPEDPGWEMPDGVVYEPAFADVPGDHLFASAIRALFSARVTLGCDEASIDFCPDDPVTRGQMAAFLTRALELPRAEATDFTDDDDSVFENAIERLSAAKITLGCNPPDNDRFCPDDPVTRGQMAAFLTRALTLPAPPALPDGVTIERAEPTAMGSGTQLKVCRDQEMSLIVRSVTGGVPELGDARLWEPTHFELPEGEVDFPSDRWFLPTGSGCRTLDVAWNPRANVLAEPLGELEVASPFGPRFHPILGGLRLHAGTDFKAETGDPVYASAPGVIVHAGARGGYGNLVAVRHVGGLDTRYAHLSAIDVEVGDTVESGDLVGEIGCTGLCTAPHLHFETRELDVPIDPMTYLEVDTEG